MFQGVNVYEVSLLSDSDHENSPEKQRSSSAPRRTTRPYQQTPGGVDVFTRLYQPKPVASPRANEERRSSLDTASRQTSKIQHPRRLSLPAGSMPSPTPSYKADFSKEVMVKSRVVKALEHVPIVAANPSCQPQKNERRSTRTLAKNASANDEKIAHASEKGIRVIIRCSPQGAIGRGDESWLKLTSSSEIQLSERYTQGELALLLPPGPQNFIFNRVLGPSASQEETFDQAVPVIERFLNEKQSGAIIAYGQTSTGKTHTMGLLPSSIADIKLGCIPRAITKVFCHVPSVMISAFELYMDQVRDLLLDPVDSSTIAWKSDQNQGSNRVDHSSLNIREKNGKIFVEDLTVIKISSAVECWSVVRQAAERREQRETEMNKTSSRSHTIITLKDTVSGATLNFVDLAGSERVGKTFADVKEASFINSSLSALGNVVRAMASKNSYVPFRDSKLTRILQHSLVGGNAVMFCTLSLDPKNALETLSTLKFAEGCTNVIYSPAAKSSSLVNTHEPQNPSTYPDDVSGQRLQGMLQKAIDTLVRLSGSSNDLVIENNIEERVFEKFLNGLESKITQRFATEEFASVLSIVHETEFIDLSDGDGTL